MMYKVGTPMEAQLACEENDRLRALNAELLEAARKHIRKGHCDTCSHALISDYECDCGFTEAVAAIAKAEGRE